MSQELRSGHDRTVELAHHNHTTIRMSESVPGVLLLKQSAELANRGIMITYWDYAPISGDLRLTFYNYGRWNYTIAPGDVVAQVLLKENI